jgi:outer membrane protein assembly factor BamB
LGSIQKSQIEQKKFQVRPTWVVNTLDKDHLKFRKIHRFSPILFNDYIIQANSFDQISAYNQKSGAQVWSLSIKNGVESSASISGSHLFFGALDGSVYSIDANNGKVNWTFPTKTENLSEPLVREGKVFILSGGNTLFALDQVTGKQIWLYNRQDPSALSIRGGSKPAFKAGVLYTGFSDGALVALNSDTGALKWEKTINKSKRFRDVDFNPIVDGDNLYVASYDDRLLCLDLNGNIIWKYDTGSYGGLLVQGNKLFYSSSNGELVALYKDTGAKIWSFKTKGGLATEAKWARGMVIFGESSGKLQFVDGQFGHLVGSFEPGRGIFASPTATDKNVYFVSNEGLLYSLDYGWNYRSSIPWL